jgi:hypothetical protein
MRLSGAVGIHDPGEAERFEPSRVLDVAEVDHGPTELSKQPSDDLLGLVVVTSDEHVGFAAGQRWVDHHISDDDVERLDDEGSRHQALDTLAEGVGCADEQERFELQVARLTCGCDDQ